MWRGLPAASARESVSRRYRRSRQLRTFVSIRGSLALLQASGFLTFHPFPCPLLIDAWRCSPVLSALRNQRGSALFNYSVMDQYEHNTNARSASHRWRGLPRFPPLHGQWQICRLRHHGRGRQVDDYGQRGSARGGLLNLECGGRA